MEEPPKVFVLSLCCLNVYKHCFMKPLPLFRDYSYMGLINRCGLAMLHKLAGGNPVQVIASHEPGIEPCRHIGNDVLDA